MPDPNTPPRPTYDAAWESYWCLLQEQARALARISDVAHVGLAELHHRYHGVQRCATETLTAIVALATEALTARFPRAVPTPTEETADHA